MTTARWGTLFLMIAQSIAAADRVATVITRTDEPIRIEGAEQASLIEARIGLNAL